MKHFLYKNNVFHASLCHQQSNTRIPVILQMVVLVKENCQVHRDLKVKSPARILMASPFQPGVVSDSRQWIYNTAEHVTFRLALPNRWDAGRVGHQKERKQPSIPSKRNSPLALLSYINDALAPRTPLLRVCTRPAVHQPLNCLPSRQFLQR